MDLLSQIGGCRLCAGRFAATATRHSPRPVPWFRPTARILIAGQAPGLRVHAAGRPFADASGIRLRGWLGMSEDEFYDRDRVAVVPMAFCFPGYDAKGSDLPPPSLCAATWHQRVMAGMPNLQTLLLVGAYAQRWHLGTRASVTETVGRWRDHAPRRWPLPHPSWRTTGWARKNPWFEAELLPELRVHLRKVLDDDPA
ncbi:uracil-DNA glycosylase family protein [Plastorhodobacter daqingensis]|uniref:Uracil-DNA glycosylase family protein n=1 Tax=Plastorhodobacter daqingensis TaxID=1387281 RepID=A0ABW2UFC5_9RHOB